MSETTNFFDKMTAPFSQMYTEQSAYAEAMREQMKDLREKNMTMVKSSMEDMLTLTRAGVQYQTDLVSEMQKISMDAMKQSMGWMKSDK